MTEQKSILIIDDDAMNREVLEAFLGDRYAVFVASGGQKGLALARTHQPDLILLDVRMPDLNGFEVCEQLKGDEQTQAIPVIFITGFDSKEDIARGKAVGGEAFLARPFDGDALIGLVARLIG